MTYREPQACRGCGKLIRADKIRPDGHCGGCREIKVCISSMERDVTLCGHPQALDNWILPRKAIDERVTCQECIREMASIGFEEMLNRLFPAAQIVGGLHQHKLTEIAQTWSRVMNKRFGENWRFEVASGQATFVRSK